MTHNPVARQIVGRHNQHQIPQSGCLPNTAPRHQSSALPIGAERRSCGGAGTDPECARPHFTLASFADAGRLSQAPSSAQFVISAATPAAVSRRLRLPYGEPAASGMSAPRLITSLAVVLSP